MEISLAKRQHLLSKVLFLDGLGRAGKFLLGKVVSNYLRVEYFQFAEILEQIPVLQHLDCIERNAAMALLQLHVDINIYNRSVGRNLNLRQGDSSCIKNATDFQDYIQRTKDPDGLEAIEKFKLHNRLPAFLIHECLPHVELFFDAIPDLLMINIQRHPIDVAHSWLLRGWGERFGTDPLAFSPVIQGEKSPVPWFAAPWQQEYERMPPGERVIKSICTLNNLEMNAYKHTDRKKQILLISYEALFSNPELVVQQVGGFLESKPYPNMDEVLKKEGCPKTIALEERNEKFIELVSLTESKKLVDELVIVSVNYEKQWNLDSCR